MLILQPDIDFRDMRVVINLQNGAEEKVLLAFLDSLEYKYQTEPDAETAVEEEGTSQSQSETVAQTLEEIKKEMLTLLED